MKKIFLLAGFAVFAFILVSCGGNSHKITGKFQLNGDIEDEYENIVGDSKDYFEIRGMSFELNKSNGLYEICLFIDNTQNISEEYELVKVDDLYLTMYEKEPNYIEILKGNENDNKPFRFECVNKGDFNDSFLGLKLFSKEMRFNYVPNESFDPKKMKYFNVDLDLIVKKKGSTSEQAISDLYDINEEPTPKHSDGHMLKASSVKIKGPLAECFEVIDGYYELYNDFLSDVIAVKIRRTDKNLPLYEGEKIDRKEFSNGLNISIGLNFLDKNKKSLGHIWCIKHSDFFDLAEAKPGTVKELEFCRSSDDFESEPITFEVETMASHYKNNVCESILD